MFTALGINNTVANYLTTMFDPSFPYYLQLGLADYIQLTTTSQMISEIKFYDTFLDQLLIDKNLTMAELFRKISIA